MFVPRARGGAEEELRIFDALLGRFRDPERRSHMDGPRPHGVDTSFRRNNLTFIFEALINNVCTQYNMFTIHT